MAATPEPASAPRTPAPVPPGLPPLAGLCSFADAAKAGLSVEESVRRLKRHHYALRRIHQILVARLTSEPLYELKMAFSLHGHLCAEHVTALRQRVGEMREPPLGLEEVPHPGLELLFDEILAAPSTRELLLGIYAVALPALIESLDRHRQATNPLVDHPTVRVCRFALLELREAAAYGSRALDALIPEADRPSHSQWIGILQSAISGAGGMDGTGPTGSSLPARIHSANPYRFDPVPRRDARFPDPYNMGVNAEVFLYDASFPAEPKTLMMYYKRLREIDVPEMMASIITETPDKPWAYYRDMTRHLWDEARHAMMGEVGFWSLNIPWPDKVMVNFTWSLALNTQLKPIERHAVLYFIEQGLMPKTGKRFEWEVAKAARSPLATLCQDYDWADEVLHARIGRDWYLKEFDDARQAIQYGDDCWSKVLMEWSRWRDEGHTTHQNWWPGLYQAACNTWNTTPDPQVLAYATSYESVRADLKNLTASG